MHHHLNAVLAAERITGHRAARDRRAALITIDGAGDVRRPHGSISIPTFAVHLRGTRRPAIADPTDAR